MSSSASSLSESGQKMILDSTGCSIITPSAKSKCQSNDHTGSYKMDTMLPANYEPLYLPVIYCYSQVFTRTPRCIFPWLQPPSQSLPIHSCAPIRATAHAHITGTITKESAMKHTFSHPQHAEHHLPFPPRLCSTVCLFPANDLRAIPQQHTNLLAPLINPQHTHSQC